MAKKHWPFTTPANYILSDAAKIEVAGGVVRMKPSWPSDLVFYAKYNSSFDADYSVGNKVPVSSTDASIDTFVKKFGAGSLRVNAEPAYIRYSGGATLTTKGTISCFFRLPDNDSLAMIIYLATGVPTPNKLIIFYRSSPPRSIRLEMWDSSGTSIIDAFLSWSPNSNQWYHLELDFDLVIGATRVFIDGFQLGSTFTVTASRDAITNYLEIGRSQYPTNCYIDDVRIYNTVQHVSNFTPPSLELSPSYSPDKPYIQPVSVFNPSHVSAWAGFSEVPSPDNEGSIRYIVSDDGGATWKYWNGSAWATGGDESNNNTVSEINSNIGSLAGTPDTFLFRAYLISDGTQPVELADAALVYSHVNYQVVINPDVDFPQGEVEKPDVSAIAVGGSVSGSKAWWFKIAEAAALGRQVVINPDVDFAEKETITILAGGESYSGAGLVDFSWWFETLLFPLLVDIQSGWPDVTVISKAVGYDTVIIRWISSHDGDYQVEVGGTGKGTGVIIGTTFGSQNVQGTVQAGVPIDTVIKAADLEAASPVEGEKRINIYVTDPYGRTNPWAG